MFQGLEGLPLTSYSVLELLLHASPPWPSVICQGKRYQRKLNKVDSPGIRVGNFNRQNAGLGQNLGRRK